MNNFLITGAVLSAIAAFLHVVIIFKGAPWYRLFGAGEKMARLAERGSVTPTLITSAIAFILLLWSAYALSGAGVLPAMPLLKLALAIITSIYLLRGLAGFWLVFFPNGAHSVSFALWSSLVCLGFGLVHLIGLNQVWKSL